MTSKEALERLKDIYKITDLEALESIVVDLTPIAKIHNREEIEQIKKSLEVLECFRKIPKQDLKDFIEWQIRYEKNFNIWLKEFVNGPKPIEYKENLNDLLEEDDLEKEEPIKYLIKIKEWLENE